MDRTQVTASVELEPQPCQAAAPSPAARPTLASCSPRDDPKWRRHVRDFAPRQHVGGLPQRAHQGQSPPLSRLMCDFAPRQHATSHSKPASQGQSGFSRPDGPRPTPLTSDVRTLGRSAPGVWRSLVAHSLWERGAVGSNPATPTRKYWGSGPRGPGHSPCFRCRISQNLTVSCRSLPISRRCVCFSELAGRRGGCCRSHPIRACLTYPGHRAVCTGQGRSSRPRRSADGPAHHAQPNSSRTPWSQQPAWRVPTFRIRLRREGLLLEVLRVLCVERVRVVDHGRRERPTLESNRSRQRPSASSARARPSVSQPTSRSRSSTRTTPRVLHSFQPPPINPSEPCWRGLRRLGWAAVWRLYVLRVSHGLCASPRCRAEH
jgi:hypothetical protein